MSFVRVRWAQMRANDETTEIHSAVAIRMSTGKPVHNVTSAIDAVFIRQCVDWRKRQRCQCGDLYASRARLQPKVNVPASSSCSSAAAALATDSWAEWRKYTRQRRRRRSECMNMRVIVSQTASSSLRLPASPVTRRRHPAATASVFLPSFPVWVCDSRCCLDEWPNDVTRPGRATAAAAAADSLRHGWVTLLNDPTAAAAAWPRRAQHIAPKMLRRQCWRRCTVNSELAVVVDNFAFVSWRLFSRSSCKSLILYWLSNGIASGQQLRASNRPIDQYADL